MTGGSEADTIRRERLRRAAEDGERLYRVRMHAPDGPTIADDNRINGILSLDLTDALGFVDALVARAEQLERALAALIDDVETEAFDFATSGRTADEFLTRVVAAKNRARAALVSAGEPAE